MYAFIDVYIIRMLISSMFYSQGKNVKVHQGTKATAKNVTAKTKNKTTTEHAQTKSQISSKQPTTSEVSAYNS
jgi:hypothetical protein